MKKYFFILATAIGLAACGDNATNDGGSIDSAGSAPMESPSDNTLPPSDMNEDTSASMSTDSASSGASTNSPNTETPATDDNQSR